MGENEKKLTTNFGEPVADNQHSLTAGSPGPILMQDHHLIEKLAHFNRERIPERVVHAKAAAAFGYFEATDDVSKWTKARFLDKVGKRTEALLRISTVAGEKGSADTARDPRGFALKLYTEDGNYDLVMNNTPVFFIQDPLKFPDFIHSQKRNPQTNLKDPNAAWDFISLSPETTHMITIVYSDRGTPKSLRQVDGFSGHTFKWVNAKGESVWVRYHFKCEAGIACFTAQEAAEMAGKDPDYLTRELFDFIAAAGEVGWKVSVQIMPTDQAKSYKVNPFDITKVWSHKDYPLHPIGRLVLNRNPQNYFADVEQAAFSPASIVPGIDFSPDKMLQGRLFAYADAHRYRLGANYAQLPVNCPHATTAQNYQRDGAMCFGANGGASPNYEPNSQAAPKEDQAVKRPAFDLEGKADQYADYYKDDHYGQAGDLYRLMKADERTRLIENIVADLGAARPEIQERQIPHFFKADPEYGQRVADALGIKLKEEVRR